MKRMLGFASCEVRGCCWDCATAGRHIAIPIATPVSRADHLPRLVVTTASFLCEVHLAQAIKVVIDALSPNLRKLYWTVVQHAVEPGWPPSILVCRAPAEYRIVCIRCHLPTPYDHAATGRSVERYGGPGSLPHAFRTTRVQKLRHPMCPCCRAMVRAFALRERWSLSRPHAARLQF
jgi:hypothetical protein